MFHAVALQHIPKSLQQLCTILQQAGGLLKQEYNTYLQGDDFAIRQKSDQSPVTQADMRLHEFLTQQLQHYMPGVPILSEEGDYSQRQHWRRFWLIDPLDGTKQFIKKTGEFAIIVCLISDGVPMISAIAVPMKNRIYIVERGNKPYRWCWQDEQDMNSVEAAIYQNCLHNQQTIPKNRPVTLAMSKKTQQQEEGQRVIDRLRRQFPDLQVVYFGSAYKFTLMLENQMDIYWRLHGTSEWDTAAGQGLLQAIGGNVFSLQHQPFSYNQRDRLDNDHFVAVRDERLWTYLVPALNTVKKSG